MTNVDLPINTFKRSLKTLLKARTFPLITCGLIFSAAFSLSNFAQATAVDINTVEATTLEGASVQEWRQQLKLILDAREKSPSLGAWQASGLTPDNLEQGLIDWKTNTSESDFENASKNNLCPALISLSQEELAVFENLFSAHSEINLPCQQELENKTLRYWQRQEEKIKALDQATLGWKSDFKFLDLPLHDPYPQLAVEAMNIDESKTAVYWSGGFSKKRLMLTFDDGPHPTITQHILDTLGDFRAKATFFQLGQMAEASPAVSLLESDLGHTVGSHSMTHANLTRIRLSSAQKEISGGHAAVVATNKRAKSFFRFPYGNHNAALQKYAQSQGLTTFFWNIDTLDWQKTNPLVLRAHLQNILKNMEGGIILFHDIHNQTRLNLEWFLKEITKRGYTLVLPQ